MKSQPDLLAHDPGDVDGAVDVVIEVKVVLVAGGVQLLLGGAEQRSVICEFMAIIVFGGGIYNIIHISCLF